MCKLKTKAFKWGVGWEFWKIRVSGANSNCLRKTEVKHLFLFPRFEVGVGINSKDISSQISEVQYVLVCTLIPIMWP